MLPSDPNPRAGLHGSEGPKRIPGLSRPARTPRRPLSLPGLEARAATAAAAAAGGGGRGSGFVGPGGGGGWCGGGAGGGGGGRGRRRRRRRRLPGASRAARCSPRPRRPSGAGGRVPGAGREWARPRKLCEDRCCAGGTKFAARRWGLWRRPRRPQVEGNRGAGAAWGTGASRSREPALGRPAARLPGSGGARGASGGAAVGKREGTGRRAGRFARKTSRAPAARPGFAGDLRGWAAKERHARLGVREWGFGTPRTPEPHTPPGVREQRAARTPPGLGQAPERGRPCPGLRAPAPASWLGSTSLGWSRPPTPAPCPRDSRGRGAETSGDDSGDRSDLGGSTGLRGEALPRTEVGVRTRPLSPGPALVPTGDSIPGQQGAPRTSRIGG